MTINKFFPVIISLLLLMLSGCKQQAIKSDEPSATDSLAWTQLQQQTLVNLQEKNYGDASEHIKQMIAISGDDMARWEYIRMALVTMPKDLSMPLIEQALDLPRVKKQPTQLYGFSRVLTQFKNHDAALELINKAIKKDRNEGYVYWRARLFLLTEQEALAEKDYLWLIKQDSANVDYIGQYATLLSYLKRDSEAIALLSQVESEPSLLFRQIVLLLQQGDELQVEQKFEQLKKRLVNKTLSSSEYLQIGELAYWLEDYETSLSLLQKVNSGDELSEAKLLIGRVLMEQGDLDRAIIVFNQVQNGPEAQAIPAYQYEVELLRLQNRMDDALTVINRALSMFKKNPSLRYTRAMIYERLDNISELEKDLLGLIEENPENADALNALGYTWADRDIKIDQAYDYIMRAYAIRPDDKAILDSVGWVYYKKGDLDQAEKFLKLAIKDNPQDEESFEHLIEVLEAQGKTSEVENLRTKMKTVFTDSE